MGLQSLDQIEILNKSIGLSWITKVKSILVMAKNSLNALFLNQTHLNSFGRKGVNDYVNTLNFARKEGF